MIKEEKPTLTNSATQTDITKRKRGRLSGSSPFPRNSLKESIEVPKAIWTQNAGESFDPILLATALNTTRRSSKFTTLIASAQRYGLVEGGEFAKAVSLTQLGKSIVAPVDENLGSNLRKALLNPKVFEQFYSKYDRRNIPKEEIALSVLEVQCGVQRPEIKTCYDAIMQNISDYNLTVQSGESEVLYLDNLGKVIDTTQGTTQEVKTQETPPEPSVTQPPIPPEAKPQLKQIFVAHGKNKKPLEQLVQILQKYKIPHIVASDEPHKGRPIGVKVAEEMKRCTAGIFIFTGDEETKDEDGKVVMRPSDNVVYELGAGSVLYGNKIVIFREDGVEFASDFTEFGRITFEKNKLDAKGLELMTELAGLEIVKFSVTG